MFCLHAKSHDNIFGMMRIPMMNFITAVYVYVKFHHGLFTVSMSMSSFIMDFHFHDDLSWLSVSMTKFIIVMDHAQTCA